MSSFITLICLFGMIIPSSIANILAYPVCHRLSEKISNYIVKVLAPRLFAITRFYKKFNFFGYNESKKQLPEQFLIISNHQSLLDIPVYMNFLRDKEVRFVAKDTLSRHIPLVSEMLRTQEHCMVPRHAKPMDAMNVMEQFGKRVVQKNQIPILFPEGTRTRTGDVGKFYSAGFRKLAEASNLPIAVCALDGGYALREITKLFTNLKCGCYRVKVLKVYDAPKTKEDCTAILDESRELIQKQLDEWRKLPTTQK